jgi:predicted aldo/keto reductase-like oxidoreductase
MNDADMARAEAPGAALEQLQKAKEQKLTRFIGISCHAAPLTLQAALERHDFDCTQMALNAAQSSLQAPPHTTAVFENTALPVALRKNMGILAMKIWLQDFLPDVPERTARNLMYYTLSLPVAAAVIGNPKPEYLEENARLAKAFKPLPKAEMLQLSGALSKYKLAMNNVFRDHIDA